MDSPKRRGWLYVVFVEQKAKVGRREPLPMAPYGKPLPQNSLWSIGMDRLVYSEEESQARMVVK